MAKGRKERQHPEQRKKEMEPEPTQNVSEAETESEVDALESASSSEERQTGLVLEEVPTDMEAAMEEDIAGAATGVSRRNPDLTEVSQTSFTRTSDLDTPEIRPLRSGSEEADWFNRFRARLAAEAGVVPSREAHESLTSGTGQDPDDPAEDESYAFSEEGE